MVGRLDQLRTELDVRAVPNRIAALLIVMGLLACKREEPQTLAMQPDSARGVVDSIFSVDEDIRRFKAARSGAAATALTDASVSRDALVERFMEALEARDTTELRAMLLTPGEFIDLYYPSSIYVAPPYKQSPELVWFLLEENGVKGISRALARYGGMEPNYQRYTCKSESVVHGVNRFWAPCVVRWAPAPDVPSPIRLFGPIMERDGRFKFVSYANDL